MNFNDHSQLENNHAFLTPSKHHWTNYDDDKIQASYFAALQAQRGTELHELAHRLIRLGQRLPDQPKTLNIYVNDCIGFRLRSEVTLYYSVNCFGTADAIGFLQGVLRISDLKTGVYPVTEKQLEIYAALFCLEYKKHPRDITVELRIYQNDAVVLYLPTPDRIFHIMDRIITADKLIRSIREENL